MSEKIAPPSPSAGAGLEPRLLAILTGLGAASALWALFLWAELLVARAGSTPFCALGEGFDCMALWDGGFASVIHKRTGMPVAGWGLAWGLTAFVLPLFALTRRAEGKGMPAVVTAIRLVGVAGAISLVVLVGASVAASTVCLGCLGTYALVGGYALAALLGFKGRGLPDLVPGAGIAAGTTAVAFAALLYPGLHTPKNIETAGREAMAEAAKQVKPARPHDDHGHDDHAQHDVANPADDPAGAVRGFLQSLPPQMLQMVADSLYIYRNAPDVPAQAPRAMKGDPNAKLHITDFTDARCGHCAQLHKTLHEIDKALPPGMFSVEARHFPLDAACNSGVQRRAPDAVSCVAAKAQICLEGNKSAFDFAGRLFENGARLDAELVYKLAEPFMPRKDLEACVNDPATTEKLNADIKWALDHNLDGTPLVLLNGKKATSFGPFIYAMILAGGDANNPGFSILPPPDTKAHIH